MPPNKQPVEKYTNHYVSLGGIGVHYFLFRQNCAAPLTKLLPARENCVYLLFCRQGEMDIASIFNGEITHLEKQTALLTTTDFYLEVAENSRILLAEVPLFLEGLRLFENPPNIAVAELNPVLPSAIGAYLESTFIYGEKRDYATKMGYVISPQLAVCVSELSKPISGGSPALQRKRITAALEYIEENYCNPETSSETVASYFGWSRRSIQRIFDNDGLSVADELVKLRTKKAVSMLTNPENSTAKLADIAKACGFLSIVSMRRHVFNSIGRTPRELQIEVRVFVPPLPVKPQVEPKKPGRKPGVGKNFLHLPNETIKLPPKTPQWKRDGLNAAAQILRGQDPTAKMD